MLIHILEKYWDFLDFQYLGKLSYTLSALSIACHVTLAGKCTGNLTSGNMRFYGKYEISWEMHIGHFCSYPQQEVFILFGDACHITDPLANNHTITKGTFVLSE